MEVPLASIIIPTLNEEHYLPLLLGSLRRLPAPLDIIVVDGHSQDRTVLVAEAFQSRFTGASSLRVVRGGERGISLQRNTGAQLARSDLLIFCDADIVMPSAEAYAQLIAAFAYKKYAVAAPVLVPIESGLAIRLAYMCAYMIQKSLLLLKRPYFAGSCLLTTKDVFAKVGGFDTGITYGEDVDYCLRAAQRGPSGLIGVRIFVSARRLIKYGYWWIFKQLPNVVRFLLTGRVKPETVFYPFGEYGHDASKAREKYRRLLAAEGFAHVYEWEDSPGFEYAEHAHRGRVALFVVAGSLHFSFAGGEEFELLAGDRIDVAPGDKHVATVGPHGCRLVVGEEIEGDS